MSVLFNKCCPKSVDIDAWPTDWIIKYRMHTILLIVNL